MKIKKGFIVVLLVEILYLILLPNSIRHVAGPALTKHFPMLFKSKKIYLIL